MRALARQIVHYIPGNPAAGGMVMTNHIDNRGPQGSKRRSRREPSGISR
jgi:hypothetical protein